MSHPGFKDKDNAKSQNFSLSKSKEEKKKKSNKSASVAQKCSSFVQGARYGRTETLHPRERAE